MSDKPYVGYAEKYFAEEAARLERNKRRETGTEQVAKQTGADIQYSATGGQHVVIEEPVGVLYDQSGAQLGPYRAKKHNRANVLGRSGQANGDRRDDWDPFGV